VERDASLPSEAAPGQPSGESNGRLRDLLIAVEDIHHALLVAENEAELFQQICNSLKQVSYVKFAWIGLAEKGTFDIKPVAFAGFEDGYLSSIKVTWDDSEYGKGPTGTAIKTGQPYVMRDIAIDPRYDPWRKEALKRGYASSIALPLIHEGEVIGSLNVYSERKDAFGDQEVQFLSTVAEDIALGVRSLRLQRSLRESEAKYRTVVEQSLQGIVIAQGPPIRLVFANPAMAKILGYTPDELTSLSPKETEGLVHPEDRAVFFGCFSDRLQGKPAPPRYEIRGICKDGETHWLDFSANRIEYHGQPAVQATFVDITEHKKAEEALRESEARLKDAQALGLIGSWEFDVESGRIAWSDQTYRLYERDPALDPPTAEEEATYYSPEQALRLREYARRAIAEGADFRYDLEADLPSGRHVFYSAMMHPIKDAHGRVVKLFGTVQDITERKRAEEALGESEARYRTLFDSASDAIFIHDMGRNFLEVNQVACERLGYSRDELLRMTPKDIQGPEYVQFLATRLSELLKAGHAIYETVHMRRDGTPIPIELSSRIIEYKGKPAVLSIARDITERKRAEQKVRLQSEITENMFEGVVLTRASDGVIVYANPRFEQIFGYDPGEFIGKHITILNAPVEGKSPEDTAREIEASVNESGAWVGEVQNVKKDGTPFWCRVSTSALESSEYGRIWVSVQEDITESKRTAEKLDAIHKHSVQLGAENSIDEIVASTLDAMEYTLGFQYAGFEEVKDGFLQIKEARGIPASLEPLPLDGPGIVVKVARTKETIRISDTRSEPAFVDTTTKSPSGQPVRMLSELAVPVIVNGSVVAVLNAESTQLGAFTESDQVLVETLAMHVSSAIARLEQMEALRSRAEELGTLQATVLDITAPYDLSTLLERIVERAVRLLGAKSGGMYLCDPEKREARCVVSYNTPHDYRGVVLKYGAGAAGRVAETGRPLIVNDYRLWEGRAEVYEKDRPFSALLSAPMIWQDRVIGILHVMEESKARRFTQTDLEMLMLFANHATIAVERTRTEEALRQSEERFRGIAERSFDAILTVDLEGRITYASPAVERITGYSQSEMLGASFQKFLPESEIPNGIQILGEAVRGDVAKSVEANILKKDGSKVCFEFAGSPILKDGKLSGFQGIARDVTERKRMEKALKESEERYRMMFRSMGDAVSVCEAVDQGNDFVFRDFNEAAERIEKIKSEDVIGRSILEVFPGLKDLGLFEVFQRVWKTGKPEHLPAGIYKDERIVGWRENYVYKLPSGELVTVYQDITNRKRLEEELRQYSLHLEKLVNERTKELRAARERLEYVISSNPAVIYTGKPLADGSDFDLTYVSERVSAMLGFEPQDFVGHPEVWERRVHPEDLRPAMSQVPRLWREGQYAFEYRFLHRDGTYRWIREETKVARDADGKPIEVNGYWTDISERKRLEEELVKAQRLATIGETAAMVGHDLRNPLQGIAGIVYLAKRDLESRKAADRKAAAALLDTIQEQVVYMDKIVSDLQDYSQPLAPKLTETNLPNLIKQTLSTITIPEAVKVTVEIEKPAENAMIDPTLMRRTLTNLTINAIQAMPKRGKLTIRARAAGDSTIMTIEDTGAGIPRKNLAKLFSPFFTTKAKGQGLGLAVCKRLVEAQGGTITVKSKARKGTAFTIKLPRGGKKVAS
jgi:PAS domain S-box-containing protein